MFDLQRAIIKGGAWHFCTCPSCRGGCDTMVLRKHDTCSFCLKYHNKNRLVVIPSIEVPPPGRRMEAL